MLERIKNLCESQGITLAALEREAGLGNRTLHKWDTSSPAIEKVQKVAKYFDVSIDYLYGNTDNPKEILDMSDDEREFLDTYMKAKKSDKKSVKELLKVIDRMLGED